MQRLIFFVYQTTFFSFFYSIIVSSSFFEVEKQLQDINKVKHYEKIVEKRFNNYKLMLYFGIVSISILFLTLSILYLFSKNHVTAGQMPLKVNFLFFLSTFFIAVSSSSLMIVQKSFQEDNHTYHKLGLWITAIAGTLFLVSQAIAWLLTWNAQYDFSHIAASYLYVISGMHAAHMIGGIVFLYYFVAKSLPRLQDAATSIYYFTDPIVKFQLNNLSLYWHFLGGLWLYLLVFFLLVK